MVEIRGTVFYTAKDLMSKAGARFSKKTFEFMRDTLRFLPKPIKIADRHGRGTIGYYPANLVAFLRKIEREHRKGKSFPQLATELKSESDEIKSAMDKMRDGYKAEKELTRRLSKSWIVEKQPEAGVKQADMVLRTSSGEKVIVEIKKVKGLTKIYFYKWDGERYAESQIVGGKREVERLEQIMQETQGKLAGFLARSSKKATK